MDDTQGHIPVDNDRDMDEDDTHSDDGGGGRAETSAKEDDEVDLYAILALDRRTATTDDIHRSYKTLSTSFHPDKMIRALSLSSSSSSNHKDEIQKNVFFFHAIKRAHETLSDPVLRLVYDEYGDDGVQIIKKVLEHQRDRKTRRQRDRETERQRDRETETETETDRRRQTRRQRQQRRRKQRQRQRH